MVGVEVEHDGGAVCFEPHAFRVERPYAILDRLFFRASERHEGIAPAAVRRGPPKSDLRTHVCGRLVRALESFQLGGELLAEETDFIVSQGCKPIGKPVVITKSRGNVVMELGGRPALEAVQEIAGELNESDRAQLPGSPSRLPDQRPMAELEVAEVFGCGSRRWYCCVCDHRDTDH